jgi:hypothetical protein
MDPLHVRIFPHSKDEFRTEDSLLTWLLTALRGRGGVYLLRDESQVKDLSAGSIVLFRYGQNLVGEAVVWKEKQIFPQKVKDRTLTGELAEYEGQLTFCPSSIRLYAPAISVEKIQAHLEKDIVKYPSYTKLDWSVYAKVLQEVVSMGTFVS